MEQFSAIFQPIQVGPLRVRNRIEVSPAEPFLCTKDGLATDEFADYTAQYARYGAGIVTVGDSAVTQAYAEQNRFAINLADPMVVHGLTKVTDAVHRWGAVASIELNLRDERLPAQFTVDEIHGIQLSFANAAERCRKAGFDMVLLHFGHGHTAATFYSPALNKRTDEYGCDTFENRIRFADELISMVRQRIGANMAIEIRMSGDELYPEGVHVEDGIRFVRALEDKIDMVHISAGSMYDPRTMDRTIPSTYQPRPTNLYIAAQYKAANLKIPVNSVGSHDIYTAEQAIRDGQCDMVAMIRAFIADPQMLVKAKAGRAQDIRPCLRCNNCTGDDPHGCPKPLRCSVNVPQGRQPLFDRIEPAQPGKKVVIVGGGAAGLEAARRLTERGLKPVLFEKNPELGGNLRTAGTNPLKQDAKRYGEWSIRTVLENPDIDVRLNTPATKELILAEKPDALIIAVGSDFIVPNVEGVHGKNVCLAADIDRGAFKPGKKVIIVGAGLTGTETAITLAREGHEVLVMDLLPLAAVRMRDKAVMKAHRLAMEAGVQFKEEFGLVSLTDHSLIGKEKNGAVTEIECDTVALSLGLRARKGLVEELSGICEETYVVGDCNTKQGNITSAVREGFYAAMNV